MNIVLEYIGGGAALPHVPARDLTEADFAERAEEWEQESITKEKLVSSGLYQYAVESSKAQKGKKKDGE